MKRLLWMTLLLPLGGCGPGQAPVSGRVLFEGKPLPAGRVMFQPADSRINSISVELDEEGNYSTVLPVGDVQVSVDNREWEPQPVIGDIEPPKGLPDEVKKALGGAKKPAAPVTPAKPRASKKYVPLPDRYYDLEQSGLGFKVPRGGMKKDLELKK